MTEIVLIERTPEAKRAYAAGLRMGMEQLEYRLDCQSWWWPVWWRMRDLRALIATMRMGADLIENEGNDTAPPVGDDTK